MDGNKIKLPRNTKSLWLVKAHYFFFFAALGPILPQINVFGKQLGVSPSVMGYVTSVLPFFWAAAKPTFGYLVDYFSNQRKLIFILLILSMSGFFCGLGFLSPLKLSDEINEAPSFFFIRKMVPEYEDDPQQLFCINKETFYAVTTNYNARKNYTENGVFQKYNCKFWNQYVENLYFQDDLAVCTLNETTERIACETANTVYPFKRNVTMLKLRVDMNNTEADMYFVNNLTDFNEAMFVNKSCYNGGNMTKFFCILSDERANEKIEQLARIGYADEESSYFEEGLYESPMFWIFVVLSCLGTVAFNVANCISDAICFDVLDSVKTSTYGVQRAFGTVGYGCTALLAGWLVDTYSYSKWKDFRPAFILVAIFTIADLFCCAKLKLPKLSQNADLKALRAVLTRTRVVIFVLFAIIAGFFDSFIIYYMFWYLEELADLTGWLHHIKLIEGVIVAGQSFIGELVFFYLSGPIIKKLGYGVTFSFCLFCYALRMTLISLVFNPWYMIPIEAIMQGPTYALCYSTIVSYAAHIAPDGYSATVQGIVAGMDDGVGFALGSLVGGCLYSRLGGAGSFRAMSVIAALASILHGLVHFIIFKPKKNVSAISSMVKAKKSEELTKMLSHHHTESPSEQIYRETTEPILTTSK